MSIDSSTPPIYANYRSEHHFPYPGHKALGIYTINMKELERNGIYLSPLDQIRYNNTQKIHYATITCLVLGIIVCSGLLFCKYVKII